jgi:hypothetical protein
LKFKKTFECQSAGCGGLSTRVDVNGVEERVGLDDGIGLSRGVFSKTMKGVELKRTAILPGTTESGEETETNLGGGERREERGGERMR